MKKSELKKIIKEEVTKVFNEIKITPPGKFNPNKKALGILFHKNPDEEEAEDMPYVWDEEMIKEFIKDLGYEDYEDIAKEFVHYTSPGDEDEMDMLQQISGNPNLEINDITLKHYKDSILNNFEM
jgi:hypothetical protein